VTDSSLRLDVLTGRQVILAPSRSLRPGAVREEPSLAAPNGGDPFAEGNEDLTPGETLSLRDNETQPNRPGWLVRVVPNQFPAVTAQPAPVSLRHNPLLVQRPAAGMQEVVIESPHPHRRLTDLSVTEMTRVLMAWQRRVTVMQEMSFIRSITVFRNEGYSAGASLPHVHSQIIGTETIPLQVSERQHRNRIYREQHDRSLLLDLCDAERNGGRRVIADTTNCLVLCPYASRVTWQVRIVPVPEKAVPFSDCAESKLAQVASHIHAAAASITQVTGPVSMNVLLVQPPVDDSSEPWFIDMLPRSSRIAGFELATDVDIITVAPEEAAKQLSQYYNTSHVTTSEIIPPGYGWC